MSPDNPLVVEQLTFRYRDRKAPAVRGLSFSVSPGEILLVAGASGCGKTTLIRCINGLIPRSYKGELSGRVLLYGQDTAGWPLSRVSQQIGTVLQDPERQILGTDVLHEVAFGLENLSLPRPEIRRRVEEALGFLKIQDLRDRETFRLSGGEKQKVALAGVLAMRPSILLLDEPLASLDPASAYETLDIVRTLADQGMSVVLIEHRVEDVLRIRPDRVLFMSAGEIRYLGLLSGLGAAVDYRQVKLPAKAVLQRARREPAPVPLKVLPGAAGGGTRRQAQGPGRAARRTAPQTLVQFESVAFDYGEREVLHGITLEIRRGDVIGVLGPNGSGKTTLAKHAIGLLKPRSGRVLVQGRDTREVSVAQLAGTVGYVFQSPSHMLFAPTVHEELSFGPRNLGHPRERIEKEVRGALRIVDLSSHEKDPPLALSFGQQKRVSIAAILAMGSRLLVMDEPTAGQDYQNYMGFMDAILQLPGFEAVLFITHDVDLAVIYANRVLLVAEGSLIADGAPHEVLRDRARLEACRLVPTSLLAANLKAWPRTGRFLRAEALAHA
jgi:energy-coupling factor transport system ATP-binding protein